MCILAGGEGWARDTAAGGVVAGGGGVVLWLSTLKAWRVGRLTVCTIAYWGGLGASLGTCLVFIGDGLAYG